MKKLLILCSVLILTIAFVGCGNTDASNNGDILITPSAVNDECPIEYVPDEEYKNDTDYAEANEVNFAIAVESIAGVWDWPNRAGNAIFVNANGTWYNSPSDHSVRGKIELTQDGRNFVVEFVAADGFGPGIVESRNPVTNGYYWIPHPNPSAGSFSGIYLIDYDRLIILSRWDDSEFEMERSTDERELEFLRFLLEQFGD